ncbi:murein biosynthesis integral membrane protein MurJ [Massilibacterium senegalense]|uniref:murein biosynthesis integral membrane protein MurJ n=1 Tax=Massilibacterium senegalense TaxID=1632858 RepID=UPI000785BF8D|nr:murein biosynthesis integral membrane protein MurJ [Massilibacterium senegalense]
MKKTAVILMIVTIISKVFGFLRDISLSYFYGASNISDVYLISLIIPNVLFGIIGAGISTGYIPMYTLIEKQNGKKVADRFTSNLVGVLILMCTVIVILSLLFTESIIKIFASGFEGETLNLAIQFTRISIFGIYFTGLVYIFSGFLQLKGNYVIPALIGIPLNFFVILSIFLSSNINIIVLSIGSVIAFASQLILLIPFIIKKGYVHKFTINFKDEHLKKMGYMALPIIFGVSINQINILVDKTLASQIAVGGISALNYADRLNQFVQGIFVLSISTAMFPLITKMASANNIKGLKKTVSEAISLVNLLVIPITFISIIFAESVVNLLFGRGAFDSNALYMTSTALSFYAVGMIGFGLREVLSRTFYSLQDTKTPMINATMGVILNIILNIILSKFLGIGGLALATSISAIVTTLLLFLSLRKKIGPFGFKNIVISFLKILIASIIMGIISKYTYVYLINSIDCNFSLILSLILGCFVYFIVGNLLKIKEIKIIMKALKL